ncbi:potassium channel family protein [Pseudodesulfovibrio sp.]|uniref:potassium channel family protein n=1 Tax=unclassified Pseudodesulfovibrio TaxID=2661612 RepID=UPI003B0077F2
MTCSAEPTFRRVAFTHFVPSLFLGVLSLYLLRYTLPPLDLRSLLDGEIDGADVAVSLANGALVALLMALYHWRIKSRARSRSWQTGACYGPRVLLYRMIVGFTAGVSDILFGLRSEGILLLTCVVLIILFGHLRLFAQYLTRILRPGNNATWVDVAELARIYLTMLAGFTLVNASLEVLHIMLDVARPFQFGYAASELFLDSLYYTVVSMTTLGFGDIVPVTWDGKLMLILQSMVSYVMFGLMIGIITRGVSGGDASEG